MAQGVFSVNTVGYVNVTVKGGFNLVANPLKASNHTIGELFKNVQGGVPEGFQVFKYDPATGFKSATYLFGEFSGSGVNETVEPGEGVFVRVPGAATVEKVITFVGEVQTQAVNALPAGFSIKGSEIPIEGNVTALGFPAAASDQIFKFSPTTGYTTYTFDPFDAVWKRGNVVETPTLSPGEAVFVKKVAAANWNQSFTIQ
jgi:hypothetical protein